MRKSIIFGLVALLLGTLGLLLSSRLLGDLQKHTLSPLYDVAVIVLLTIVGVIMGAHLDRVDDTDTDSKQMLDEKLLHHLLKQHEGQKLDFKSKFYEISNNDKQIQRRHWDELIKDVLALANGNAETAWDTAYIIIGAGDELKTDGTRDLFDVGELKITRSTLLKKINASCAPPLGDIHCATIVVDGIRLFVIAIPPSPHVYQTTRRLETSSGRPYQENSILIRRGEGTELAKLDEIQAIQSAKRKTRLKFKPSFIQTLTGIFALVILTIVVFISRPIIYAWYQDWNTMQAAAATKTALTEVAINNQNRKATQTVLGTKTRNPTETSLPARPTITPTYRRTATFAPTKSSTPTPTPLPKDPPSNAKKGDLWISPIDGMKLVYVPAGEFLMGTKQEEISNLKSQAPKMYHSWINSEVPQHSVYLDAYWVDMLEVSNSKYILCLQAGICKKEALSKSLLNDYILKPEYANYPVIDVPWSEAKNYCEWAGRRLPSEAEWEKAARGTDGRIFPWGDIIRCEYANYWGGTYSPTSSIIVNACNPDDTVTTYQPVTPVDSYPEGVSPYGALNMAGNASEWVMDWFGQNYYSSSTQENPRGPDTGKLKVIRGGSIVNYGVNVRSATRIAWDPLYGWVTGIRCILTP